QRSIVELEHKLEQLQSAAALSEATGASLPELREEPEGAPGSTDSQPETPVELPAYSNEEMKALESKLADLSLEREELSGQLAAATHELDETRAAHSKLEEEMKKIFEERSEVMVSFDCMKSSPLF